MKMRRLSKKSMKRYGLRGLGYAPRKHAAIAKTAAQDYRQLAKAAAKAAASGNCGEAIRLYGMATGAASYGVAHLRATGMSRSSWEKKAVPDRSLKSLRDRVQGACLRTSGKRR